MIVFECPSCKTKLQVADEHAGKSIQCPKCQTTASAPASEAVIAEGVTLSEPASTAVSSGECGAARARERERDDDLDDEPRRRRDKSDTTAKVAAGMGIGTILAIVFGVGCCLVVPVMIALLVPAVQKVREAAARTQSTNNLKQIGLAMHSHQDAFKRLPFNGADQPGKIANPNVPFTGSWAYQILPFIDQAALFQGVNRQVPVQAYMCPGRSRPSVEVGGGGAWTDYFYNNYLNDAEKAAQPDAPDRQPRLHAIIDGTSNTIFAGHGNIAQQQYGMANNVTLSSNIFNGGTFGTARAGPNAVASPPGVLLRRDDTTLPTMGSWGGPFPNGALMVMGDGTVRMFPYNTNNFNIFLTPAGGEAVPFDFP